MQITSLREFIEIIPVCATTASLDVVLSLFQQTPFKRLLLIDEHSAPVGIFDFQHLLPYLLAASPSEGDLTLDNSPAQISTSFNLSRFAIEPIETLHVSWQLPEVLAHLRTRRSPNWVVVDDAGAAIGLFDSLKFWQQSMAPPPTLSASTVTQGLLESSDTPLNSPFDLPFQVRLFSQLIQLLEQLPIPLMLQTGTGRVIGQNLAWREQIGELQDLSVVQREAALFLENTPVVGEGSASLESFLDASDTSDHLYADLSASVQAKVSREAPSLNSTRYNAGGVFVQPTTEPIPTATSCHLGATANTCVCVCSMKNGQERIWQFVKVPLGVATDGTEIGWLRQSTAQDRLLMAAQFQLASLESNLEVSGALGVISAIASSETLWLVQAQDTTEHQQVAKELAAKNADLLQLNRLKDEFLACISHELKTPLTSILGLSSLLKDQLLGPLNERQARYAQLIYQGGRHLILIVNDILDLTRIETGQMELLPEPVNIEVVCHRAFEQARHLLLSADSGIPDHQAELDLETRFSLNIDPSLSTLIADELRLRQMLANLLSNALKFTETGGNIGLQVGLWEGWIAFTVWDTGIGIPANKQHLIFQKFQQLENPLTRRFEGTGLGLVLTQRLARLHGGDVTFTSVEGKGSEFTLLLPPSPPSSQSMGGLPETVKSSASALSQRLVMVVEAVPRFLEDLSHQLTGLGYRVAIARSGTEALEKIRRLQPTVIFLNPVLPLLSGWDVLTLLKSDSETQHIPVVMTATRIEKSQSYSNGADSFLSLPIQTNALQHCLDYWMNRITRNESNESQSTLTVLHLHPIIEDVDYDTYWGSGQPLVKDLNHLLHPYHCRVLEVDDLEQADLLVRVWKPDLILLDGTMANPVHYLTQLSQSPFLSALPLIILTPEMTQAANQVPGLMVFPYLAPLNSSDAQLGDASALWQVMQIAVGTHWTSNILIADLATLPLDSHRDITGEHGGTHCLGAIAPNSSHAKVNEWLQVLLQYVQTAQFRGSLGRSWADVNQQIDHGGVDLLLLCVHATDFQRVKPAVQALAQLDVKPPIVVWNCLPQTSIDSELMELLEAIATCVLPPSLSMPELLEHVRLTLES